MRLSNSTYLEWLAYDVVLGSTWCNQKSGTKRKGLCPLFVFEGHRLPAGTGSENGVRNVPHPTSGTCASLCVVCIQALV